MRARQDHLSEGAALRHEADRSGLGTGGGEGGVHPDGRVGVDHPHAVRSHHPQARGAHLLPERRFFLLPRLPRLLVAGGDHHQPLRAARHRVVHDSRDRRARHHDHRQIDRLGQIAQAPVGTDRMDGRRVRVDRIDRAGEAELDQVVQDLTADRLLLARGADDGDRPRPEDGVE